MLRYPIARAQVARRMAGLGELSPARARCLGAISSASHMWLRRLAVNGQLDPARRRCG
jgi:hypothetical protein